MKRLLFLALLAACNDRQPPASSSPTPAPTAPEPPPPAPPPDAHEVKTDMPSAAEIASLVKANNHFALELWAHAGTGNVALSPTSIATALAMTWAGAKGETAAEMRAALHFEGETDHVVSQWARVSYALAHTADPLTLEIANRLYGDAHYQFDTIYFTITRQAFDAPLQIIDFRADPEAARKTINGWVAEKTEQRIEDLIPPRVLDADTRLVIVNAIYFLADWAEPFDKAQTSDAPFHVSPARTEKVPTMHRTDGYRIAQGDGAALLELPYQGETASMYVLLPDKRDGLAALERRLPATLAALQGKLAEQRVAVSLPTFVIDPPASLRLVPALKALGIKQLFDPDRADLTGIANPPDPKDRLYVSDVLHKAFVKVDEKGTEAAAATAVVVARSGGMPAKPIAFTADHPFLFLIVDKTTGLVLFIGRVVEPKAP